MHRVVTSGNEEDFVDQGDQGAAIASNEYFGHQEEPLPIIRCSTFTATEDFEKGVTSSMLRTLLLSLGIPSVPSASHSLTEKVSDDDENFIDFCGSLRTDFVNENEIISDNLCKTLNVSRVTFNIAEQLWPRYPVFELPTKQFKGKQVSKVALLPNLQHGMTKLKPDASSLDDKFGKFVVTANRTSPTGTVDQSNIWQVYAIECPEGFNCATKYAILVGFTVIDEVARFSQSYYFSNDKWVCYDGIQHSPADLEGEFIASQASVLVYECCDAERFRNRIRCSITHSQCALGFQTQLCYLVLSVQEGEAVDVSTLLRRVLLSHDKAYNTVMNRLVFRFLFCNIGPIGENFNDLIEKLKSIGLDGIIGGMKMKTRGYALIPDLHLDQCIYQYLGHDIIRLVIKEHIQNVTDVEASVIVTNVENRLNHLSTLQGISVADSLSTPSLNNFSNWKACSICGLHLPNNKRTGSCCICSSCK